MKMSTFTKLSTLILVGFLTSCGGGGGDDIADAPAPANVNVYLNSLPTWSDLSPVSPDTNDPSGPPSAPEPKTIENQPYTCTTTPYSLTRTPDRIVTLNPDSEILWAGSLLQGKGYLGGLGSLAELPIRQRAPVSVSIDLLTSNNTRDVPNPTVASVTSAIGGLISDAQAAGHTAGSNIYYTKEDAYSLDQLALSMGMSASYMGATVKASLSADISTETRTVTAYFVQRMFTVSMALPQSPEEVFSDEFTDAQLQQSISSGQIGADNLPVFVSSVAYGRILMFSFTSTASKQSIEGLIEVLYAGQGVELSAEQKAILSSAKIQVVTVGGDADSALALIRANNLNAYFQSNDPLTTARPISYTVRNLADNLIASVSETTSYNLRECVAVPPPGTPVTGAEYQITFDKLIVEALPNIDGLGRGTDKYNIELQWEMLVTDAAGVKVATKETPEDSSIQLVERDRFIFPAPDRGGLPNKTAFVLHNNRQPAEKVELDMAVFDYDSRNARDTLRRVLTYNSQTLPTGSRNAALSDAAGNVVRVYFTITKTGDLTD